MIFKEELIRKIIDKSKSQTRRLVKENENKWVTSPNMMTHYPATIIIKKVFSNNRTKYQVGKSYPVQPSGKKGVWYCPNCKGIPGDKIHCGSKHWIKALRIRITEIRKEKLLDITEKDAKKEGFHDKYDFLEYIHKLYNKLGRHPSLMSKVMALYKDKPDRWNPDVWVLSFSVVDE